MEIQDQQKATVEQKVQVERFLTTLVGTQRCLQLYPANSPMIEETMLKLACTLDGLFGPSNTPVTLGVIRDQFADGREFVASTHDSVRRFAAHLYRLQVKVLTVHPGVTMSELDRFLTFIGRKPEDILAAGGLAAQMDELKIRHISLDEASDLLVVDRRKTPDQWDILDYLRNRHGGKETPLRAESFLPQSVDAEELLEFFRAVADGTPEVEQYFHNTLTDPAKIMEALNCLAGARQMPDGDCAAESPELLDEAFDHISDAIARLPESVQETYAKNMAQAIGDTRDPVRRRFTEKILPKQVGQFGPADKIVEAMGDDKAAEILAEHVMFHQGTRRTLENFLDGIDDETQRGEIIKEAVAANLAGAQGQRFGEIVSLLEERKAVPQTQDTSGKAAPSKPAENVDEGVSDLLQQVTLEHTQAEHMSRDVFQDCTAANASLYATDVALSLQKQPEFGVYAESTAKLVAQSLKEAFDQKMFELMVSALERARDNDDFIPGLQELSLAEFATDQRLDEMINALRPLDPVSAEYASLVSALRLCGNRAVTRLFNRLVVEPARPARMFLIQVLLSLGPMVAGLLGQNILHPEWYVVRNIVYVLGKVAPESSLDALNQTLQHPESRVRLELVQALGAVSGPRVEEAMLKLVMDPDPGVAGLAAGFLRRFDGERVLPVFRAMLTFDGKSLLGRPYVVGRMMRVFAEVGTAADVKLLAKFQPPLLLLYSRSMREVRRDCRTAMREIGERLAKGTEK